MTSLLTTPTKSVFESNNVESLGRSPHYIRSLPILVLFPHNRCNCRCVMCDIWRIRQVREITVEDLLPHLVSLRRLRVQWVVFSGGEPQMHSDFAALSRMIRRAGIRVTLLTAGLLLEAQADIVANVVDDVIVSLDGAREVHNQIRGVPKAFERLERGVEVLRKIRPDLLIRGRSTVQRGNHTHLRSTILAAKGLGLNSISFLATDVTSEAFNRPGGWPMARQISVGLGPEEIAGLAEEVELLIQQHSSDIAAGFVVEGAEKLRRIVDHFRAQLGEVPAVSPHCNAPWVSAVVEADGTVRPCFFHRSLGNIHEKALNEILNSDEAVDFRRRLDIPSDPICQKCVCSLHISEESQTSAMALEQ